MRKTGHVFKDNCKLIPKRNFNASFRLNKGYRNQNVVAHQKTRDGFLKEKLGSLSEAKLSLQKSFKIT